MRKKARSKKWTKEVGETFDKELARLRRMNPQMAEYGVQRNYLELMLELPWGLFSDDKFNLKEAVKILDRDHFGLEKVGNDQLYYCQQPLLFHLAIREFQQMVGCLLQ